MAAGATSSDGTSEVARQIARVAARLFAAQGYDATSVRAIVEAAGVAKPTLYYHFGSKEGLAQALLTVPLSGLIASLREIIDAPGDPVAALERMFEAHFELSREDPDRGRFMFALLFGPHGATLSDETAGCKQELPGLMFDGVRRLVDAGLVVPDRAEAFARACRGLIVIETMDYLYRNQDFEPRLAHRLVSDLLRGFGEPGAIGRGD